jgi:fucose 4-O-acetylase-like acetyltransferase
MTRTYKYSIENFRAIAIIFVMLSHMTTFSAIGSLEYFVKFLFVDATTFFIFISGYLFACTEPAKNFNYLNYLFKKIRFVIGPYLLFLFLPILAGVYLKQHKLLDLNILQYTLWSITVGGAQVGPMWFIPLITIFFLLSFVFIKLKPGLFLGFITIFFLGIAIYTQRPLNNANAFLLFIHFLGFYLLGISFFYLGSFFENIYTGLSILLIITCVIVFFGTFYLASNASWMTPLDYQSFFDQLGMLNLMQLGKLTLLIGLFIFLEKFCNHKNNYLSFIAKISFGLFFIHGFFLIFIGRLVLPNINNDIVNLLIELFGVMTFSLVTVYLIQKMMRSKSRYVIGC